jgi:glutamate synthase domain-containing protein 3
VIVVLGLHTDGKKIVHNFPCTGMHGGKLFLRGKCDDIEFPSQVTARAAGSADLAEIQEYVAEFCKAFDCSSQEIMNSPFTVVTPDSKNPYKQMYVAN